MLFRSPEYVTVGPAAELAAEANSMVGTIETLLFAGDHYEANVRMASDVIQVHPSASGNWHEGQQVRLNLASEHLQIWAGTERT